MALPPSVRGFDRPPRPLFLNRLLTECCPSAKDFCAPGAETAAHGNASQLNTPSFKEISMTRKPLTPALMILTLLAAAAAAGTAQAQATIDHNKALAGNITPGDVPGYPITLSRPGHYKLMGNLSAPANMAAVQIEADGVTLDLNGFTIAGQAQCSRNEASRVVSCQGASQFLRGVFTPFVQVGTVVRNGTVRGFGSGVLLNGSGAVHDLSAMQNMVAGVTVQAGRVERVVASLNGAVGISMGHGTIAGSTTINNGAYGISGLKTFLDTLVIDTVASGNRLLGIDDASVRGTLQSDNGATDRSQVRSLGGNADANGVY